MASRMPSRKLPRRTNQTHHHPVSLRHPHRTRPGCTTTPRSRTSRSTGFSGAIHITHARRQPQNGAPAGIHLQNLQPVTQEPPPPSAASVDRFPRARSRICACNSPAPASHLGRANCTGAFIDRKVSATISNRPNASARAGSGPSAAIQAAFICGSPAILLSPLNTNVSAGCSPQAKLRATFFEYGKKPAPSG